MARAADDAEGQSRDGGAGSNIHMFRSAEDGVAQQGQGRSVEAILGGHAGDSGVGHGFGHQQGPNGQGGDGVWLQKRCLVFRQPGGDGKK